MIPKTLFTGWVDHPDRVALARGFAPRLSAAAAFLFVDPIPDSIPLYVAWKQVLGAYPDYPAQEIGDCTSFGSSHALDLFQCLQILDGHPLDYRETCTEAVYGLAREAAGMLNSRSDGCYGSAVAKALTTVGVVSRDAVGAYSGSRAKEWGDSGVPAEVRKLATSAPVGQAAMVESAEELDAALNHGYPVFVCSNQGFTLTRDAEGVCGPQGSWAHCMGLVGRRRRGQRTQYLIINSWGSEVPKGPLSDDQPPFSFWADGGVVGRMLAQRDSFTVGGFDGFVRKAPRWSEALI